MTMDAKGQTCTTSDPNALRSAARASKGLATRASPAPTGCATASAEAQASMRFSGDTA